jgi:hypothetical protein
VQPKTSTRDGDTIMQCIMLSIEVAQPEQPLKLSTYYIGHEITMKPEEIRFFLFELAKPVEYKKFHQTTAFKKNTNKKNLKRKNHVSTKKILNQGK